MLPTGSWNRDPSPASATPEGVLGIPKEASWLKFGTFPLQIGLAECCLLPLHHLSALQDMRFLPINPWTPSCEWECLPELQEVTSAASHWPGRPSPSDPLEGLGRPADTFRHLPCTGPHLLALVQLSSSTWCLLGEIYQGLPGAGSQIMIISGPWSGDGLYVDVREWRVGREGEKGWLGGGSSSRLHWLIIGKKPYLLLH